MMILSSRVLIIVFYLTTNQNEAFLVDILTVERTHANKLSCEEVEAF